MKPVFYLKVNRDIDYAYPCIMSWITVAYQMEARYFIICDNDKLKNKIIDFCGLEDDSLFINSMSQRTSRISEKVANQRWKKASDAQLTTFFHAKKQGFKYYWNIDADDTMFCLPVNKIITILSEVQAVAAKKGIGLFSLDMWWTIHGGDNWTFGITYTDMSAADWFSLIEKHFNDSEYEGFNLDSYFNYLRNHTDTLIETFYIKNVDFIHWGGTYGPLHYKFRDGIVVFPYRLTYMIANTLKSGTCKVSKEIYGIDAGIKQSDGMQLKKRKYLKNISKDYDISPLFFGIKNEGINTILMAALRSVKRRLKK